MKKFVLAIAFIFSILAAQAQTKTVPTSTDNKEGDEQENDHPQGEAGRGTQTGSKPERGPGYRR